LTNTIKYFKIPSKYVLIFFGKNKCLCIQCAGRIIFYKKILKYCDGISKYFTMFSQKKLQENKTNFINISSSALALFAKKLFIGEI
jgi:hypothetical protein